MTIRILQFHEERTLIAGAQTAIGKVFIWIAGIALLILHDVSVLMLVSFTLVLLLPDRRRSLLMLVAFGLIVVKLLPEQFFELPTLLESVESITTTQWLRFLLSTAASTIAILGIIFAAIRLDQLPAIVRRHPLLILHLLVLFALALSSVLQLQVFASATFVLWRASFLLKAAAGGKTANTCLKDHLFYMVPVFGGSNTPFGKGPEYLSRYEATDPESIARSQLAGIKLLGLAMVWMLALALMDAAVYGSTDTILATSLASWSLNLPYMADLMRSDTNPAFATGWMSVYLELVRATTQLAIWGHVIIGCLRLLGFNVFRNTYKPLFAQSIVEFWNRFFFYFKELLVDFFFYPAFYRSGWAGPRLRLFLAIFAAAFVGNVYYHLLREYELIFAVDWSAMWTFWYPRLIYCSLLVLGIWLSMLRQLERRRTSAPASGLSRLRAIAGVWTFYGLIHVWLVAPYDIGVGRRWTFFMSLVGL